MRGTAHTVGDHQQALGGDVGAAAVVDERATDVEHHIARLGLQLLELEIAFDRQQDALLSVDEAAIGHAHAAAAAQRHAAVGADALAQGQVVGAGVAMLPVHIAGAVQTRLGLVAHRLGAQAVRLHPTHAQGAGDAQGDIARGLQPEALVADVGRDQVHRDDQRLRGTAGTCGLELEGVGHHLGTCAAGLRRRDGAAGHQADRIGRHLAQRQIAHRCQTGGAVGADHRVTGHGQCAFAGGQVHRGGAGGDVHRAAQAQCEAGQAADGAAGAADVGAQRHGAARLQQHRTGGLQLGGQRQVVAGAAARLNDHAAGHGGIAAGRREVHSAALARCLHLDDAQSLQATDDHRVGLAQEHAAVLRGKAHADGFGLDHTVVAADAAAGQQLELATDEVAFAAAEGIVGLGIDDSAAGHHPCRAGKAGLDDAQRQVAATGLQEHFTAVDHHLGVGLHGQGAGGIDPGRTALALRFQRRGVVVVERVLDDDVRGRVQLQVTAAGADVGLHQQALTAGLGAQQQVAGDQHRPADVDVAQGRHQHQGATGIAVAGGGCGRDVDGIAAAAVGAFNHQGVALGDEDSPAALVDQGQASDLGAQVLRAAADTGGRLEHNAGIAHDKVFFARLAMAVGQRTGESVADGAGAGLNERAAVGFQTAEHHVAPGHQIDRAQAAAAHRAQRLPIGLQNVAARADVDEAVGLHTGLQQNVARDGVDADLAVGVAQRGAQHHIALSAHS